MTYNKQRIEWSRIMAGQPVEGGRLVYGVGIVFISDRDPQEAVDAGGDPEVQITEAGTQNGTPAWCIGRMYPRDPTLVKQGEREKLRANLLRWYFDKYNDTPREPYDFRLFAEKNSLQESQQLEAAYLYLIAEGLVKGYAGGYSVITHLGIREIEGLLRNPGSLSERMGVHMNVNNDFSGGQFGSVQIGGAGNSASVNQNIGVTGDELAHIATSLRQEVAKLPLTEQVMAQEVIEGILEESQKEKPKLTLVNALVAALPVMLQNAPALIELMGKISS